MKSLKLITVLILMTLCSCKQKISKYKPNQQAVLLNNQAITLVAHLENNDSSLKAISLLDKATSIDSNYFLGYLNKLMFLIQLRKYEEAILTNNKLIELQPSAHDLYLRGGLLYQQIRDSISASKYFEKSLKIVTSVLDTMSQNNRDFVMLKTNHAINLIMLNDSVKADMILKDLYNNQPDDIEFENVEKKYIQSLMNKNKIELLNSLVNPNKLQQ